LENESLRDYNLDFNPKFLFAKSRSCDELSISKAATYLEFISMKKIFIHFNSKFLSVPCTKSEIFLSDDMELNEKQKLLNFIFSVMKIKITEEDVNTTVDIKKDYELEDKICNDIRNNLNSLADDFLSINYSKKLQIIIKYVLANVDPNYHKKLSLDELITRVHTYLVSLQVYDNTPFLYPIYGSSEFNQALCRLSSVFGTIFIVNENLTVKVYINKEHLLNNEGKKYIVNVYDKSK
jgi:Rab GDP dissociation inhibitor